MVDTFVVASNETPISSGKGEAIIIKEINGNIYDLKKLGIFFFNLTIILSFESFFISSLKEVLINVKISRSPIKAPRPPINPVSKMALDFDKIKKNKDENAAVNPYE